MAQRSSIVFDEGGREETRAIAKGEIMLTQSTGSSHPALSYTDGVATSAGDFVLLVARVLIGVLLLATSWSGSPNVGYLTSLKLPNPQMWSYVALTIEYV